MKRLSSKNSPLADWRWSLSLGLTLGIGLGVTRNLQQVLEPHLGFWGTLPICAAAAGLIGGIVALVVYGLFKPGRTTNEPPKLS